MLFPLSLQFLPSFSHLKLVHHLQCLYFPFLLLLHPPLFIYKSTFFLPPSIHPLPSYFSTLSSFTYSSNPLLSLYACPPYPTTSTPYTFPPLSSFLPLSSSHTCVSLPPSFISHSPIFFSCNINGVSRDLGQRCIRMEDLALMRCTIACNLRAFSMSCGFRNSFQC